MRNAFAREHGAGMCHKQGVEDIELRAVSMMGEPPTVTSRRSGSSATGSLVSVAGEGTADNLAESPAGDVAAVPAPVTPSRPQSRQRQKSPARPPGASTPRDPYEQFLNRKRLGQVVVGAARQPCHLVHRHRAR